MINLDFGLLEMKKPTRTASINVWISDTQGGHVEDNVASQVSFDNIYRHFWASLVTQW